MKNKSEKLKKIIELAVERGWNFPLTGIEWEAITWKPGKRNFTLTGLLLSHSLAKAVFGEQDAQIKVGKKKLIGVNVPNWKWHIKEAVVSKDPIDYYYKFINKSEGVKE